MTIFDRIYQRNIWNGTETRSGPGSNMVPTSRVSRALQELVVELDIHSVLDAACGEGYWQPELPGYMGLDVSKEAIAAARQFHPDREYRIQDVRTYCPSADLVICRDAMQHLSLADGQALLKALIMSGSRWLLASTYVGGTNVGPSGEFIYYEPDLEAEPFDMPPAERLYHDGYDYVDPDVLRDPGKMLGLWRLR